MRQGAKAIFFKSLPAPTAADYLRTGLISMWDGIENAGWGQHEDSPNTFSDLIGSDSILKYSTSSAYPTWFSSNALRGCYYLNGSKSSGLYNALVGGNVTMEFVATRESTSGSSVGAPSFIGGNWMSFSGFIGYRFLVYNRGTAQYVDGFPNDGPYGFTLTLAVDGNGVMSIYKNGEYFATVNPGSASAPSNGNWSIGQNLNLVDNSTYFPLLTHCLRVYGRALSASEVAANHEIDKERFRIS